MKRVGIPIVIALALALGGFALGSAAYVHVKAQAGQWLLNRAWAKTQSTGRPCKPWPWADTRPLARLSAPAQRVDLLVLAGASGRTLAWGPGHLDGSAALGKAGNAVVSAHRDTHFRFLARVAVGETLIVEVVNGERIAYRVTDIEIVDAKRLSLRRDSDVPTLTLVTCYPFDAIVPGGPLRYVVVAKSVVDEPPAVKGRAEPARLAMRTRLTESCKPCDRADERRTDRPRERCDDHRDDCGRQRGENAR